MSAVWYWLVEREAFDALSAFLCLVPAFGLGLSLTVSGDHINTLEWVGVALILSGIAALIVDA